jgi:hypothetical protein
VDAAGVPMILSPALVNVVQKVSHVYPACSCQTVWCSGFHCLVRVRSNSCAL